MATSENVQWTVLIVAEEDTTLDKIYRVSRNTSINEVMKMWTEEFHLIGNWKFLSPNNETEYEDWMSIEMVGETFPKSKMVNLKAELSDTPIPRPVSEIFAQQRDQCHLLHIEPTQKLYEALSCLPGRSSACQCNDQQLNLFDTVEEAGLENNALIHEPRRQINVNVKLSHGSIVIIRVPEDSLVLHLYEAIQRYEVDDFSLEYEGRHLKRDERVKELKQVISVTNVQFTVNIRGQRITWTSKSEPIDFLEFISQLALKGNFKEDELEILEYRCIGCQRCLSKWETDIQILPVKCCREKSLTLKASLPPNESLKSATDAAIGCLRNCYFRLFQSIHKKGRTDTSRNFCTKLKQEILEMEMNYNTVVKNMEELLKRVLDEERERLEKGKKTEIERNALPQPGVKLYLGFYSQQFSVAKTRPEVQSLGYSSHSGQPFVKCILPGLQAGWAAFYDVRNALQPLFDRGNIRGIAQYQGTKDKRTVVDVDYLDDDADRTGDSGYVDIDGRHYSSEDVEEEKWIAITAPEDKEMEKQLKKKAFDEVNEGSEVLIVVGQQRTALDLYDLQSGVELCVIYHPEQFSVAKDRPEALSWGESSDSPLHCLDCIVPTLQGGWATFNDVKKALQPLFEKGNIRGIEQLQGSKNRMTAVSVQHPDDAEDRTGELGYDSADGRHYLGKSLDSVKHIAITAPGDNEMKMQLKQTSRFAAVCKGGEVLIVVTRRRPTLTLYDLPLPDLDV